MKLYYSPGACSLAPHIALHEAGTQFAAEKVDLKSHKFNGQDFYKVNPKGYVPVLELENGQKLTENAVILQYIADQSQSANLLPKYGSLERYRCQEWLNFIATELHKSFSPFFNPDTPDEYKKQLTTKIQSRFSLLNEHFANNQYLMGEQFTVADGYLFTICNWAKKMNFNLPQWASLNQYFERVGKRPGVQAAMREEGLLQ